VVIGDEVLVTVMAISGHTVRLGIEAPAGVSIYREEIWIAVKEENRAAATADAGSLPTTPPAASSPAAPAASPAEAPAGGTSAAPAAAEPEHQASPGS